MTGIICLDKPEGITSFGALARLKRIAGERKAGHAGTLDPMATGVLPAFFGGATRFIALLPQHDKAYEAVIQLGVTTDTLDITGRELSRSAVTVGAREVEHALERFRGEIMQTPPMYSAVSKDGVRLYELARQGVEVEREARPVTVHEIALAAADEPAHTYTLRVRCSAGTYIRSIADDLGRALGCGAVLCALRRTMAAGFPLADCVTLEQAQALALDGALETAVCPLDRALSVYPAVHVTQRQAVRFQNGGALSLDRVACRQAGLYRLYGSDGTFLGVGEVDAPQQVLAVKRVFVG